MLEGRRGFCLSRVSWLCLLLFLLRQPTWKPLPLFVHSSTEGKLISTVWGQTDKQAQTQPDDAIGQGPRCPSTNPVPHPYPLFPASLLPAYGNKLSLSQSLQRRGLGLYVFPSLISRLLPQSCPVLSNWPVATPGHWWSLGAEPRQAKPEQNGLCAIRIFKCDGHFLWGKCIFACLSCMYISFIYCWGLYFPTRGTWFSQMSVLSIRMTM